MRNIQPKPDVTLIISASEFETLKFLLGVGKDYVTSKKLFHHENNAKELIRKVGEI
jgi:hypothetical protein